MNFAVTIDGVEQSRRAFQSLNETVRDFREAWPEIHMYFLRATLEEFDAQGARGGAAWQPLSESYGKWKAKRYPGKPILVRTERLRRSFSLAGQKGGDQIYDALPESLTIGSAVPYARFHQRGTSRMAARPILQPTQRDIDRIVSRLFRFAERGARDAGFQTQSRARLTPGAE
jgi:phage gpG-like protein